MPTVTGLREGRDGRVAVELDGERWRTLPAGVVVRAGLRVGRVLDREGLRALRRELRRGEALDTAGRALRRRDLTEAELGARLERAGVAAAERAAALGTLGRAGLVDDRRVALARAAALAARGRGDAAIRWDLERRGVSPRLAEEALAELEPERERAARIAARRGAGAATARLLAQRGFGEDAIETVCGTDGGADG